MSSSAVVAVEAAEAPPEVFAKVARLESERVALERRVQEMEQRLTEVVHEVESLATPARAEPAADGAQLVLENSGRKIAYNRLRVTDATGKELPARMEVVLVAAEVTRLKSLL